MPADVQVAFYRLCQEAFNNIAKHARASQVAIRLKYDAGRSNYISATMARASILSTHPRATMA